MLNGIVTKIRLSEINILNIPSIEKRCLETAGIQPSAAIYYRFWSVVTCSSPGLEGGKCGPSPLIGHCFPLYAPHTRRKTGIITDLPLLLLCSFPFIMVSVHSSSLWDALHLLLVMGEWGKGWLLSFKDICDFILNWRGKKNFIEKNEFIFLIITTTNLSSLFSCH